MLVPITEAMADLAVRVGMARQQWHEAHGTHDRYGTTDALASNIDGALGEIVVATVFGVLDSWVQVCDDFKNLPGDIAPGIQVRATRHPTGRLITHPDDKDDDLFCLVRLFTHTADIVGWIRCADTKRPEYWTTLRTHPCYVTPTARLTRVSVRLRVLV